MNKLKNCIKQNIEISILFIAMIPVYVYEMFTNRPWYDELYTYYYFISRGPIYAGIHWPVPNNHMGYSVLSGVMNYVGNAYIGLRGGSVICSLASILLLYRLIKKIFGNFELIGVVAFVGAYLVHSLAFQGRGYAFSTMALLISLNILESLITDGFRTKLLVIWVVNFAWALYTIPSNVYWVVPVCLLGGAVLLAQREYKKLIKLIVWSLLAAAVTFTMYSLVWLAIGSNLVCKDQTSTYYGLSQVKVIMKAPFTAWNTGMQYMLATPYIQSSDRSVVIRGLLGYLRDLFNLYYSNLGVLVVIIYVIAIVIAIFNVVKCGLWKEDVAKVKAKDVFANGLVIVFGIMLPAMLIVQSVQPYKRVFSYFAVIVAVMLLLIIRSVTVRFDTNKLATPCKVVGIVAAVLVYAVLWSGAYRYNLADRENDIADVLENIDVSSIDSIYYTDDYQKFVLKFYYDVMPVETTLEEARYVMVSSDLLTENGQRDWPMLTMYGDFKNDYVLSHFTAVAKTDKYVIYLRN